MTEKSIWWVLWRYQNVHIALRDINKTRVEIGERQNRRHNDTYLHEHEFYFKNISKSNSLITGLLILQTTLVLSLSLHTLSNVLVTLKSWISGVTGLNRMKWHKTLKNISEITLIKHWILTEKSILNIVRHKMNSLNVMLLKRELCWLT